MLKYLAIYPVQWIPEWQIFIVEYTCYNDGCHLKKYAINTKQANQTATSLCLPSMNIVINRMHFSGHTGKQCRENYST